MKTAYDIIDKLLSGHLFAQVLQDSLYENNLALFYLLLQK